jgi:hypothetical protein
LLSELEHFLACVLLSLFIDLRFCSSGLFVMSAESHGVSAKQAPEQKKPPSAARQKDYIKDNAHILNKETKIAILSIVMNEVGKGAIMERAGSKEVDINLDMCEAANEEVILHIYNIVKARLESLNKPVGSDTTPQRGPAKASPGASAKASTGKSAAKGATATGAPPSSAARHKTPAKK